MTPTMTTMYSVFLFFPFQLFVRLIFLVHDRG
uniref:Uncharacterized protein n=1 Tax=Arundo donax TaxID=35708 RepID=A0A0A8YUF3_ARUDO